jgi:undecaprenyl-diphosphatase
MQKHVSRQLKKVWQTYNPTALKMGVIGTTFMVAFLLFCNVLQAQNWDINTLDNINPSNPSSKYWQQTTASAYPISVGIPAAILIAGYLKHDKDLEKKGWKIVGALAVNTVLSQGFKYAINRERPYEKYGSIYPYDASEKGKSFPSGHTSTVFALAASLSIEYPKWYVVVPAYVYAASVGYSRLYLGEHYPSDVLAGAALGVGSAYLSNWLAKKVFKIK